MVECVASHEASALQAIKHKEKIAGNTAAGHILVQTICQQQQLTLFAFLCILSSNVW